MDKRNRHIIIFFIVAIVACFGLSSALSAGGANLWAELREVSALGSPESGEQETLPQEDDSVRYGVKKTAPVTEKDLKDKMGDLHDAENASTNAVLDEKTGDYVLGTKIGDGYLNTPFIMTKEEYERWSLRRSMSAYFKRKNQDA
ncbi:MAG: hypothetical protein ACI4TR_00940, partial [Bacteroidaceae bacterium]